MWGMWKSVGRGVEKCVGMWRRCGRVEECGERCKKVCWGSALGCRER